MDHILETLRADKVILHEEVARDGAQGKTLLNGAQRALIATAHSKLMGPAAHQSLVFMTGFPSAGKAEFEAVRQVVAEVDSCYLGVAARLTRADIDTAFQAVRDARYGRIVLIMPTSPATAGAMLKTTPQEALRTALDAVGYARDLGGQLEIDVALADAARADFGFVASSATKLTEAGASTNIVCDTVGGLYPAEAAIFFTEIQTRAAGDAHFIVHMHNDLGFGLVNTLTALSAGIRGLTSSWLGLGERSGMPATEQLLFVLTHEAEKLGERLGAPTEPWHSPPNLKAIVPLARQVSEFVGFELRTTDPIVGMGVNTISTGVPFSDPNLFSPFDADAVLGVPRSVLLTALASRAIVHDVSSRLGFTLTSGELSRGLEWVKEYAHRTNTAVVPESALVGWLQQQGCTSNEAQCG